MTNVIAVRAPPPVGNSGVPGPSAMWVGPITSSRVKFAWWPDTQYSLVKHTASVNPPAGPPTPLDPNTYNVYRAVANGTPQLLGNVSARSGATAGDVPFYWFLDTAVSPATTYTYTVKTLSPTGIESQAGPDLTITTLSNGASTLPTPVTNPDTWIVAPSLPVGGTTWTCTNTSSAAVTGTGTLGNVGCSFGWALANANIHGGDIIILTAGATYPVPNPAGGGYIIPAFDGTNGWTYIVSSELQAIKTGGLLPIYTAGAQNYSAAYTLSAIPAVGATSASLSASAHPGGWQNKTGIYPVEFRNGEQRYALFTKNSAVVDWGIKNSVGTPLNPAGWQGVVGPGLVATATALTAVITVQYLPGVTLYDTPAMPLFQFGGPGTNGLGIVFSTGATNVRCIGLWVAPRGTNATDNGKFTNFNCFVLGNTNSSIYLDRCMMGGDPSTFSTSGAPNYTITSTTYGFVFRGVGNIHCDNFLTHQCYLQGINSAPSLLSQDSNAFNILGGGPLCIQNTYIEAGCEGVLAGGSFVPKLNIPHDFTYRWNFNTKPLWWRWAPQQLYLANGVGAAPRLIFGDYVKNHCELKCMAGANLYANVHWNCWFGALGGYNGLTFTLTARDQQSAHQVIWDTCPWAHVADVDIHDNVTLHIGQFLYVFSGVDYCPNVYAARVRVANNLGFIQCPVQTQATQFASIEFNGLAPDITIDHNTFVIDPTFCLNPGTTRTIWFTAPAIFDRLTITNNIMPGLDAAFLNGILTNTSITNVGNGSCTNLTWANNLTVQDNTGPFPAGTIYKAVPYNSIGMSHWVNVSPPVAPIVASDWNVVGGTGCNGASCATASTTAGPIGSTF